MLQTGGENAGASEITDYSRGVKAGDDGQTADVMREHFLHGIVEQFVGVGDDQVARAGFENGSIAVGVWLQGTQDIAAGDDAGEFFVRIEEEGSLATRDGG